MTAELQIETAASMPQDLAVPDIYFTAGYGLATATAENASWRLARFGDRILLPYLVRPVDAVTTDAATPYGYSGIHVASGCPPTEVTEFWSQAVRHWRAEGMVTLFLRFSPLDESSVEAARALGAFVLNDIGDTVTVPVSGGAAAVWNTMQGRARTAVRKARNAGLEAGIRPAGENDVAPGAPFRNLYESTMRRVCSRPDYVFPDRYYQQLLAGVGKSLFVVEVTGRDGATVAASLVLRHGDRVHYHLSGSERDAARQGANNLLVWTILAWAAGMNCSLVHLGGGLRPDDPLFAFKRSFGGLRTRRFTASIVLDPDRYGALVAARAQSMRRQVDDLLDTGFFPAYRLQEL
ncbi:MULTISPECIES: GNAT family N-acetyltransferase [unclassified Micromonospora]|uniref:GNAT family N-acetyltransferase n=1 Tax=unclassified Micromonospora TaxID=2617518 RepID=UPI0036291F0B